MTTYPLIPKTSAHLVDLKLRDARSPADPEPAPVD
jgi:hypothetical protein